MTAPVMPLKANPTNRDLQEQAAELHVCLHEARDQLDAMADTIREDRDDSKQRDALLDARLHGLEKSVDAMILFFGVPRPAAPGAGDGSALDAAERSAKPKKTVANWGRWAAMATVMSTGIGALGVYHLLEPPIVAFFVALQHALMAAH